MFSFFRLQKYHRPQVLNSFQVWPISEPFICFTLKSLLEKVITQCTDQYGLVDYVKARTVDEYPIFEEAVCQLQGMSCQARFEMSFKRNCIHLTRFGFTSSLMQLSTWGKWTNERAWPLDWIFTTLWLPMPLSSMGLERQVVRDRHFSPKCASTLAGTFWVSMTWRMVSYEPMLDTPTAFLHPFPRTILACDCL
jgi:hypothetical protein